MTHQMGLAPDEVEDLKRRLRQHDQMYATMQQQGKPFEALEHLEKGLFVRKELHGADHPEVGKVCQVFTTSCNTLAMNSLQRGMPRILPCQGGPRAVLWLPGWPLQGRQQAPCVPCKSQSSRSFRAHPLSLLNPTLLPLHNALRRQSPAGIRAAQEGRDLDVAVWLHNGQKNAHEAASGDLQQFWLLLQASW